MARAVPVGPPLFWPGETTSPITLTALRVGVGVIMVTHGWLKATDVPAWQQQLTDIGLWAPQATSWLAIAGELLGGAGLLLGLLTRVAAIGVLATMVTAILTVHVGHGLLASSGGFEYPLTLALVAAFFVAQGAGPFSLDAIISARWPRPPTPQPASATEATIATTAVV